MILRPEADLQPQHGEAVPAWDEVARTQQIQSDAYLLVRQPDHARLSGDLAQRFALSGMPPVTDEIIRGISLHDEGWAGFDCGKEKLRATPAHYSADGVALNAEGKPLSFQQIQPGDFLRAWRMSIDAAETVAPIAALIVSGHFYRLARSGIAAGRYLQEDEQTIREFIQDEERRRERLTRAEKRTTEEIEYWTDVLQFCDLLSLYLCCGSRQNVEFPQRIAAGATVTLRVEDVVYVLSPSLFPNQTDFVLQANRFPGLSVVKLTWTLR